MKDEGKDKDKDKRRKTKDEDEDECMGVTRIAVDETDTTVQDDG